MKMVHTNFIIQIQSEYLWADSGIEKPKQSNMKTLHLLQTLILWVTDIHISK
jgi:hypothetical protein